MIKLKKRIYLSLSQCAIKFYYWCEDRYWDTAGDKKRNTDRIINNIEFSERVAELFDVPPVMLNLMQGNNHKKEKHNDS